MRKKDDELKKLIGKNIRRFRRELDMTQAEFSEILTVTEQYLSQMERGVHAPSIPVLHLLARNLHISIDTLFGLLPDRKPENEHDLMALKISNVLKKFDAEQKNLALAILLAIKKSKTCPEDASQAD